jgi:hypothetical protein
MDTNTLAPAQRRKVAQDAVDALGKHRGDHVRLRVRCSRSHQVASVYATSRGLVYTATARPRAHGSRDFIDAPHHDSTNGREQSDFLDVRDELLADDELRAGCECGPRTLSRAELRRAIAEGERAIQVS